MNATLCYLVISDRFGIPVTAGSYHSMTRAQQRADRENGIDGFEPTDSRQWRVLSIDHPQDDPIA